MLDYLSFVKSESNLFNRAVAAVDRDGGLASTTVPSCDGWSAADLTWHLAEVQYFWASVVEGNLTHYSQVVPLERPADDQLVALQGEQGTRLAALLAGKDSDESCWSWHPQGQTVGWVLRRQAHESLIHRIDAELTAVSATVGERTPVDEALAADGVDEILQVMLDIGTLPEGSRFEPSGRSVRLVAPEQSWDLGLGRVLGTDDDGKETDLAAIDMNAEVADPTVEISAQAAALDLWLWRREPLPASALHGDTSAADELYALAEIE